MAGIWAWAETWELLQEVLRLGKSLGEQMGASLTAILSEQLVAAEGCFAQGADRVLRLPALPPELPMEAIVPVLAGQAQQDCPELVLIGSTQRGREIAARLAGQLQAGMVSDCIAVRFDRAQGLEMDRVMYGGRAVQTVRCLTRPQMATIPARAFPVSPPAAGSSGEIVDLPAPEAGKVAVVARKPKAAISGNLLEARTVVCVGRGLETEADLALARELAAVLGAEIACTRPVVEEYHWLPEHLCIGLSGQQVNPNLYLGVGVSGQVQHVVGIKDAEIICAINRDEQAPIFKVADYGVVGDFREVLPRLIEELKQAGSR